jgi:DNA-binding MarR family transcriptional regulator
MAAHTRTDAMAEIDRAFLLLGRQATLPRTHELYARRAGIDLDRGAVLVLARLDDEGAIRPSDLARLIGVEPSTITRQVQDLARRALVTKQPDPSDGRSCVVQLTEAGHETLLRYRAARRQVLEQALASWDPDDLASFADGLDRFVTGFLGLADQPER